jgi:hypothetical protein
MLEQEGWDTRRVLAELVGENRWPDAPASDVTDRTAAGGRG